MIQRTILAVVYYAVAWTMTAVIASIMRHDWAYLHAGAWDAKCWAMFLFFFAALVVLEAVR